MNSPNIFKLKEVREEKDLPVYINDTTTKTKTMTKGKDRNIH